MVVFCYRIKGVLRAVTPLHIGSGARTGVIKHCYPFIPGAVLRGAVGVSLMRSVCKLDKPLVQHESCQYFDNCLYAQLFGEEFGKSSKVFFRYAYPLHLKCGGLFRPAAKTLHKCSNPQCGRIYEVFVSPAVCESCGEHGVIKPLRGFRCDSCGYFERVPVRISRMTLTAVDRTLCSAAQVPAATGEKAGTIHTLEVIQSGSVFGFEIIVHEDLADAVDVLKSVLVRALPDEGIGGSKSRGLGKVAVEDLRVDEVDTSVLEGRAEGIDVERFRVRLVSPMILDGKYLDESSLLEGARRAYSWAFHKGKPSLPEVRLVNYALDDEVYGGWSLKAERRREIKTAISPGSVFDFTCEFKSLDLALSLAALEYYAVGSYKPHGCGQIIVVQGAEVVG
ncbi:MAG: RAMP superfamily CRISPR-associated protein [Candidatus Bathyarchaeia archaeon]